MCGGQRTTSYKWAQQETNLRPSRYERPALTAELWALAKRIVPYPTPTVKRGKLG